MAVDKIAMEYDIKQNQVSNSTAYGKWYAQPVTKTPLSLKGLARHMAEHNGSYRTSTIKGVLEELVECMSEMISTGQPVKLDGLGTFYPTFECEGAETPETFSIAEHLKGIHIRFQPEGTKDEELTSRSFMKKCALRRRFPKPDSGSDPDGGGNDGD